jgi:hypothetical protein
MSRGGEDLRRQKRRWFLRCRQGTELGLRRRVNPFILPKLSPDCGRRLTEVKKMHCNDSAPADFAGVNLPLPWTTGEAFPMIDRIFSKLLFSEEQKAGIWH